MTETHQELNDWTTIRATDAIGTPAFSNPRWTHDETDPSYSECGATLWTIALGFARKFSGAKEEAVHGHTKDDLAMMGVLHVFIQAKRGRLDKVPADERWNVICRILWNRMIDESRRYSNRFELQSLTITNTDGNVMDSDEALELVAADKALAFRTGCPVPRRELRLLESLLDCALDGLVDAMLIRLRFGLCRNDEFTGDDSPVQFLDAMTVEDLVEIGYGHDRFAVKRRLDTALGKLRTRLLADLERRKIVNFTT